jgi:hypothetical protein
MGQVCARQEQSIQQHNQKKIFQRDSHQSVEIKRVILMKKISTLANSEVDTIL